MKPSTTPACYMLITTDGCDQIVATLAEAKREKRDLITMGFEETSIKAFASWAEATAYEDKLSGR